LGDLQYYDSVRISDGHFRPDEDVLWDLAVHDLGCLDAMRPRPPVALSATGAAHPPGSQHSVAYLTMFYDDGLIAHVHASWLSPVKVRRIMIGGGLGRIVLDERAPGDCRAERFGLAASTEPSELDGREPVLLALEHFVSCISAGSDPVTDGRAGFRVVRLLEHASRSLAQRGRPVDLVT
ncbi:MAG TPA: hypothetical protein VD926_08980, partial [Acidimicrobiales bacterium]|nr:hypothetical protein [Acidimicrobiales bacterium]